MTNKIKVTCEIPAPPEGWVYDGWRPVRAGDSILRVTRQGCALLAARPRPYKWSKLIGSTEAEYYCDTYHRAVRAPAEPTGQERNQAPTSGDGSILPEGWTRDGKWILAPIEWEINGQAINPRMEAGSRHGLLSLCDLGELTAGYRCVGFCADGGRTEPYSILGGWRATHAVLLEEAQ